MLAVPCGVHFVKNQHDSAAEQKSKVKYHLLSCWNHAGIYGDHSNARKSLRKERNLKEIKFIKKLVTTSVKPPIRLRTKQVIADSMEAGFHF